MLAFSQLHADLHACRLWSQDGSRIAKPSGGSGEEEGLCGIPSLLPLMMEI